MTRRELELDLDAVIRVDKIPMAGREVKVTTDAEQRELLAKRFLVSEVSDFAAQVTAIRFRGGIRAQGVVSGTVLQPCVVTGELVAQSISEAVDRVFLPGRDEASEATAGAEVFVNLEEDDLPDYFEGDDIDLGDLVMEIFALAIDLYPRASGAELPGGMTGDNPEDLSPFAALKALKKD